MFDEIETKALVAFMLLLHGTAASPENRTAQELEKAWPAMRELLTILGLPLELQPEYGEGFLHNGLRIFEHVQEQMLQKAAEMNHG